MTPSAATLAWEAHNQLRLLRLACPRLNRTTGVHATGVGDAAGVGGTGAAGGAAGAQADYDAEAAAAAVAARTLTATHLSSWAGARTGATYVDDGLRHVLTVHYAPPTLQARTHTRTRTSTEHTLLTAQAYLDHEPPTTSFTTQVYLDYELVMETELWLRPQSETGGEDGTLSLPAGGAAGGQGANVTAPALRILDSEGRAHLGFAAGRSDLGLEQYEIHEWWFKRNVDSFHGQERLSQREEKLV